MNAIQVGKMIMVLSDHGYKICSGNDNSRDGSWHPVGSREARTAVVMAYEVTKEQSKRPDGNSLESES